MSNWWSVPTSPRVKYWQWKVLKRAKSCLYYAASWFKLKNASSRHWQCSQDVTLKRRQEWWRTLWRISAPAVSHRPAESSVLKQGASVNQAWFIPNSRSHNECLKLLLLLYWQSSAISNLHIWISWGGKMSLCSLMILINKLMKSN